MEANMNHKLLAVYLGGRAAKCNTELHDVVFAVGPSIESTYDQLLDKWFAIASDSVELSPLADNEAQKWAITPRSANQKEVAAHEH
jgi:hypothetical protein